MDYTIRHLSSAKISQIQPNTNTTRIRPTSNQLSPKRASIMDIANNKTARNTIININKIEQIMKM